MRSVVLTDENHPYQNEHLSSEWHLLHLKVLGIPEWCRTVGAGFTETLLPSLCVQQCKGWGGVWCVAHPRCLPVTWLGTCGYHKAPMRAASSCLGCCCALPASRSREKRGWPSSGAISIVSGHVSRSNQATKLLELYSQVYCCVIYPPPELFCADCGRAVLSDREMAQSSEISFLPVECPGLTQPHGLV